MTVKDLVDCALFCDGVEIVVREHGRGQWIQGYRISKNAEMWRSEYTVEFQETISNGKPYKYAKRVEGYLMPRMTQGEIRDVFHGIRLPMRIIKKDVNRLPENVAKLQVASFQPRHIPSFHGEQLTHNDFTLDIDCYPEGWEAEPIEVNETKLPKVDQLEGQMSIEDFL